MDSTDTVKTLIRAEKSALGIDETLDEDFHSFHDAWRGVPRITLCLDRLNILPRLTRVGSVRHEVGHSILHGSLEYYVFNLGSDALTMAERRGVRSSVLKEILFLASVAVKDYEVTRLLQNHGYERDQTALSLHHLKPSRDDLVAWEIAELGYDMKLLYLTAQLKPLAVALPLLKSRRYGEVTRKGVNNFLRHLPPPVRDGLSKLLNTAFPRFRDDTHRNVRFLVNEVLTHSFSTFSQ